MPDFSYSLRVEQPVEPVMAEAFTELLNPLQSAMVRISHEHSKLQEKCNELERENARLRTANQALQTDVSRLTVQLATVTTANRVDSSASKRLPPEAEEEPGFAHVRTMKIHDAPVHSVTMGSADKIGTTTDLIATASWDTKVKLYSYASDAVVQTLCEDGNTQMNGLYSVAFAKTAPEVLGCTSCDKCVYLWNHHTGRLLSRLSGHTDEVNGIDFHSTQQVMCTASDDCKAIIWDFQEGLTLRTLGDHRKAVYGATFLGGGEENEYLVATCSFDKMTRVFDMRDKKVVALLQTHTDDVIGIDYSERTHCLATGSDDGKVCLWDARSKWKLQQKIDIREASGTGDNEVKRVAFSPNGTSLAAACSSGQVLVYDVTTFPAQQLASLGGHTDCTFDVTWGVCPKTGQRLLVSASHDNTCRCWVEVV